MFFEYFKWFIDLFLRKKNKIDIPVSMKIKV